jgi:hypothetical protein
VETNREKSVPTLTDGGKRTDFHRGADSVRWPHDGRKLFTSAATELKRRVPVRRQERKLSGFLSNTWLLHP